VTLLFYFAVNVARTVLGLKARDVAVVGAHPSPPVAPHHNATTTPTAPSVTSRPTPIDSSSAHHALTA
jgi:hypothetical protein